MSCFFNLEKTCDSPNWTLRRVKSAFHCDGFLFVCFVFVFVLFCSL